jgi:hypothetical protein
MPVSRAVRMIQKGDAIGVFRRGRVLQAEMHYQCFPTYAVRPVIGRRGACLAFHSQNGIFRQSSRTLDRWSRRSGNRRGRSMRRFTFRWTRNRLSANPATHSHPTQRVRSAPSFRHLYFCIRAWDVAPAAVSDMQHP